MPERCDSSTFLQRNIPLDTC